MWLGLFLKEESNKRRNHVQTEEEWKDHFPMVINIYIVHWRPR